MKIGYDPSKREKTLRERGLDFKDAAHVFEGDVIDIPDVRKEYGEERINTVGSLRGRVVIVCWTQRGDERRIISMRKANEREQASYRKRFGAG